MCLYNLLLLQLFLIHVYFRVLVYLRSTLAFMYLMNEYGPSGGCLSDHYCLLCFWPFFHCVSGNQLFHVFIGKIWSLWTAFCILFVCSLALVYTVKCLFYCQRWNAYTEEVRLQNKDSWTPCLCCHVQQEWWIHKNNLNNLFYCILLLLKAFNVGLHKLFVLDC